VAAFDPTDLLPAEREVVACTGRGEWAELSGRPAEELVVRATFLRHLLLGLPAEPAWDGSGLRPWPIRLPGVRVRGARIEGVLDLADCAGPAGAGLPALALEDCDIPAEIELSNARLARLSLKGSRIVGVKARDARIDGPFDLSAVAPLPAASQDDEVGWIDAHGSTILGDLLAMGARLRAPPKRENVASGDERYALRLSAAEIEGSLRFTAGAVALGGISLRAGRLHGDLQAEGATLRAGEGDAFDGQAARIDGNALLRDGFDAQGRISLYGAKLAGSLACDGAKLANRTDDGTGVALMAESAEIGGAALLRNGFEAQGRVSLLGAKLAGSLVCTGAKLANRTDGGTGVALEAQGAEIGGAALLRNGFEAQGRISLHGAKLGGGLDCDGAKLANRTDDGTGVALDATNAEIGGDAFLRNETQGRISLWGAKITGSVYCGGARFRNETGWGPGETLSLREAVIGGSLELDDGFASVGRVTLWDATIGRSLDCSRATLVAAFRHAAGDGHTISALDATNARVGGDANLTGATVLGRLAFRHLKVGGNLTWDRVRFPREVTHNGETFTYAADAAGAQLDLSHARIGAAIEAHGLTAEVPLLIDLSGTRAGTLDDEGFPAGWGAGPDGTGTGCALDLDGFVYDRIADLAQPSGGFINRLRAADRHAKLRLDWLQRPQDVAGKRKFVPQPYRQLAKVLRAHGITEVARKVAIEEQRVTPSSNPITQAGRWLFWLCFGFGLAPWRASVTLLVLLAVGYCGVREAQKHQLMVVNVAYSTGAASGIDPAARAPVFQLLRGTDAADTPRCGKHDIQALFYAMDMMLPVIPLHQEDKCELARSADTEWWRWLAAIFSIVGKIAASLALLTYTGVLKPKEE